MGGVDRVRHGFLCGDGSGYDEEVELARMAPGEQPVVIERIHPWMWVLQRKRQMDLVLHAIPQKFQFAKIIWSQQIPMGVPPPPSPLRWPHPRPHSSIPVLGIESPPEFMAKGAKATAAEVRLCSNPIVPRTTSALPPSPVLPTPPSAMPQPPW